ncbi:putative metal-dependent HD superfamily phosphohydrolase [Chryseobacterium bernardetii]|jgi:predicted metal-dependent HD superfamily phosphohydrolase|uniref:Metal-dependent HD superfamily phosphohydrolase n=3 Tax=Chryseobacterium TaxID=59732 RepID=A0ACC6J000_9FLAO|nr:MULTISPECIES: Pycsar system effector family protein [Chryseobacterium]MDR6371709.1 putative metal-dependent HD superfamily phosphohydrolase [Chryseobacterium vietnamense]MDR6443197.1 putative metal-dependent HD superfamily phosphohydrolase [Chryseobacterium bernardetii]MDR6460676.1 putative metal-dependent HD superfamily phosphohydrolase [Chryseobacterium vietnamense]MDR6488644.1 putative metal-dependent HD superfamily phosphohydrolase [Chryseobacterium vietnamense]TQM18128.1 putative metal
MSILQKAKNYVEILFKDKLSSVYFYHNFIHTAYTVNKAEEIMKNTPVSEEDQEKVLVALWFHDTGYIECALNHEERSVEVMKAFLHQENYPENYIADVEKLILATKIQYEPQNLLEKIVKDADFSHFAGHDYSDISDALRKEWELTNVRCFSNEEWNAGNLDMLKNKHTFYTDYAKENWEPLKKKNIKKIEKKLEKEEEKKENKKEASEVKKEKEKSDRSVDTLFRVTLNNHTRLSDIADSKANILLSVNAIIISVCLSVLVPKLDAPKNSHLILPSFILLLSSVLTIIFAILSTKPNVTKSTFTSEDIVNRKVNLLFFGNFQQMLFDDYNNAMKDLIKDRDYIYDSMVKDLYYLGKVLNRKYKLLSITYKIFMAGIIISVLSFGVAFLSL